MNAPSLEEMAALEAKTTAGPWRAGRAETWNVFAWAAGPDRLGVEWVVAQSNRNFANAANDAAFIASARTFVPWAISTIRQLQEENASLRRTIAAASRMGADLPKPGAPTAAQLKSDMQDAGDRRDWDECDRLEAEIEKLAAPTAAVPLSRPADEARSVPCACEEVWRTGRKVGRTIYRQPGGILNDELIGVMDTPEQATLAAAAPELYLALEALVRDYEPFVDHSDPEVELFLSAHNALDKARGETR